MQEKTINQFIKELAAEKITGKFRATNGEMTFVGTIHPDGSVSKIRVRSAEESRRIIKEMLNDKR